MNDLERIERLEKLVRVLATGFLLINAAKDLDRQGVLGACRQICEGGSEGLDAALKEFSPW